MIPVSAPDAAGRQQETEKVSEGTCNEDIRYSETIYLHAKHTAAVGPHTKHFECIFLVIRHNRVIQLTFKTAA